MEENTEKEMVESTERVMEKNTEIDAREKEGDGRAVPIERRKHPYVCGLMNDDWDGFMRYYHQYPQQVNGPITVYGDTAIHVAASCSTSQGRRVVEFLIDLLPTNDEKCNALKRTNDFGNNALHELAMSRGNLDAAKFMLRIAEDHKNLVSLLEARNRVGETPLYRAAALGQTKLVRLFIQKLDKENQDKLRKQFYRDIDTMSILHIAVSGQHFETAYFLQKNYPFLAQSTDGEGLTSLQLLAQMPTAFEPEFYRSRWMMLIYHCIPADIGDGDDMVTPNQKDDVESMSRLGGNQPRARHSICWNKLAVILKALYTSLWRLLANAGCTSAIFSPIWTEKRKTTIRNKLIHLLVEKDYSWVDTCPALVSLENRYNNDDHGRGEKGINEADEPHKPNKGSKIYTYTPLLIATITGIVPIVEEILSQHPQAADHVSYNEEHNILHLAIKHRQEKILDLIRDKKPMMWRLNDRIDANGNTILHQAADMSYYSISISQELVGPAMQLQEELRWVSEVKKMVPRHYIIHRNKKGQTAEEVFNEDHNALLKSAQDWIKDTAASCSTVAVLVATVVFAAAYTIPGGNDARGFPNLYGSALFWVFTVMDVVAIACSLSSVAFFLSILSSPLEYPNFCHGIPRKLMCGFVLLFLSMAATMVAFAATILLLVRIEKKWTKSLLYSIAFFPIPLFGLLQFPMIQCGRGVLRVVIKVFVPLFSFTISPFSCKRTKAPESKAIPSFA